MVEIKIAGRQIGEGHPPYIIAEMSANHGGDLNRALNIIDLAAQCGADAIKFQAYTPDTLTLDSSMPGFVIDADNPWKGRRLYELYESAATPYEWFPTLYERARKMGITPFTSPFGADSLDMLEQLGSPAYKIASFEVVDQELIAAVAQTGKPIILSTGLCTIPEIEEAVAVVREAGCQELALLKCNSAYPARTDEANLLAIQKLQEGFMVPVGYSDHTLGTTAAIVACALGACIIEKHFIDSRQPETADSAFSATPSELTQMISQCLESRTMRGKPIMGPTEHERGSLVFRRSLYVTEDVPSGGCFSRSNVRSIRPGNGLEPKHLQNVIGRRAARAVKAGEPLTWEMLA